jgi:tetratricopeptide (TPR) repeat protein
LGLLDLEAGRYATAQKRFEYVIQLDPQFPEAQSRLQEAMMGAATSSQPTAVSIVPTVTPMPEITPTPDMRNREELFAEAGDLLAAENWEAAISTLDQLRYIAPDYQPAKIDGMYYMGYRNMGVQKILYDGNLEGGMYDLSIAERFGLLDVEANSYRTFARYYVTGASFWEVDWSQVINYFSLVYQALPNLHDGGYTATERYRLANLGYAEQLFNANEFCDSQVYFETAYTMDSSVEGLYDQLELARQKCAEGEGGTVEEGGG